MKKLALALALVALLTGGCGNKETSKETSTETTAETGESTSTTETQPTDSDSSYKVGILQFARHSSLDNCRIGFLEGLKASGIEEGKNLVVDYQNADADSAINSQIATNFVSNKVDMICAVATPSAMSAYNAALSGEIPVIYTAITDPIAAGLAKEDKSSVGNITGTSDALPVEAQLKMIREIMPEAKTIGIIYTTSEANSESAIQVYQSLAGQYGFTIETVAITQTSEIPLAVDNLLTKVDCFSNLTDNTVVNSLPMILDKTNEKKVPVFGSEIEQVRIGCLAAEGIDYLVLGQKTGEMAAKILKGESKAADMPYEVITEPYLYVNTKVAEDLGIQLDAEYLETAREIFDTISESKPE